jgi:hypothetical protein
MTIDPLLPDGRLRAIRFYERHGWTNVGKADKEFQVAGGTMTNTVAKMTKPLRATTDGDRAA